LAKNLKIRFCPLSHPYTERETQLYMAISLILHAGKVMLEMMKTKVKHEFAEKASRFSR